MLILHTAPDTAATILRLVAAVAGLPLTLRPVDREAGALASAGYRALNPTGTIPVLETPDGPVSETGAALLWLSEAHGLGPAPGTAGRAAFLKWLFYIANTPHPDVMQLIYPERYAPPEIGSGHSTLAAGRFLTALGHLDEAARRAPSLFPPGGVLVSYLLVLARWAALYPEGHAGWFNLAAFPTLWALAQATEALPEVQAISAEEGMGPRPFTAPRG